MVHPRGCPEHYEPFELTDVAGALAHARWQGGEWVFWAAGISRFLTCRRLFFFALAACVLWRRVGASVLMRPPDRAQLDTWSTALLVVVRMCACAVVWDVWVCGMRSTSRSVDLCVLCLCALCCCESPWLRPQRSIRCPVSRTPGVPRVIGSRTKYNGFLAALPCTPSEFLLRSKRRGWELLGRSIMKTLLLAVLVHGGRAQLVDFTGYMVDTFCWDKPNHEAPPTRYLRIDIAPQNHTLQCMRDITVCYDALTLLEYNAGTQRYSPKYQFSSSQNSDGLKALQNLLDANTSQITGDVNLKVANGAPDYSVESRMTGSSPAHCPPWRAAPSMRDFRVPPCKGPTARVRSCRR